jgi:glycosyltransferase involved in cell wall biosynthesis
MKIAQIAPLFERVPPQFYGGTERVVFYLTEQLLATGHKVTLFASGDSMTRAKLISCCDKALRLNENVTDASPHHVMQLDQVRELADEFDIVHFHTELLHFPLARQLGRKAITTLHGRLDFPDLQPFFKYFSDVQVVSVSNAQRQPLPFVNWLGSIYHGLPSEWPTGTSTTPRRLSRGQRSESIVEDYLVFLGRICPEKRPDRAIDIARTAGISLRIAAKVDKVDIPYWNGVIKPMIGENSGVDYIGEVDEDEKRILLRDALALLNPIDHPEPFGLAMIEAMACGTPVIAYRRGSVPEILDHGISGFIVDTFEEAVQAVKDVDLLDRGQVRSAFESKFTVERMAEDYIKLYESVNDTSI